MPAGNSAAWGLHDTSGGLHGVGASVVNALSEWMDVEVAQDRRGYKMRFERGKAVGKLKDFGAVNRRGTLVTFKPDPQIFGKDVHFSPAQLYRMARSKAYLFRGVEIRWSCDPSLAKADGPIPTEDILKFPGGLLDFLTGAVGNNATVSSRRFSGRTENRDGKGAVEWAFAWAPDAEPFLNSYCNTIPTPQGGTHEQGLRNALAKALRTHGERANNRKTNLITPDDIMASACAVLSIFISEPEFQGQTKEKLSTPDAQRLSSKMWCVIISIIGWRKIRRMPTSWLDFVIDQAEDRLKRKAERDVSRKSATRKLRLPGKLADCTLSAPTGTEIFLVEGDSSQRLCRSRREIVPPRRSCPCGGKS